MPPLPNPLPPRKLLQPADIRAVDSRTIISEQRRERPADDLAAVEDQDLVPEEPVPGGKVRGVDVEELEDFDEREGRAREDGFAEVGWRVEEAGVGVHVGEVEVREAFDVL